VMSTHQMHQIEELAQRLLMISRGEQKLYGPVADIRRQFAQHAIIVEGEGQWDRLQGVERVVMHDNGRQEAMLYLQPQATADEVLGAIARADDMTVRRFELALPSLNDIFIEVAGGGSRE